MENIQQILLTSIFTIIGGILIYVTGRFIEYFILEPILKQKQIIGDIADMLIFNANIYANPISVIDDNNKNEWKKASEITRKLSSQLNSRTFQIPFYNLISKLKLVINKDKIEEVCSELIGLSNSYISIIPNETNLGIMNSKRAEKIKKILNII